MTPDATAPRIPTTGWILLVATLATFLAGQWLADGAIWFGSGYVLRAPALAGLALLAVLLASLARSAPPLPPRTWLAIVLLPLIIVLFGMYTASHRGLTLRLRDAGHWIAVAVIPLALLRGLGSRDALPHLWRLLVGGALILSLCGLAEYRTIGRIAASFGRPAVAATVLGALVVPAWVLSPFHDKIVRAIPPLLLLAVTVLSGSRVALVATGVSLLAAFGLARGAGVVRRRAAFGVAGATLLAAALMVLGVVPAIGNPDTLTVRRGLHAAAWDLTMERPVQGHGLGTYAAAALRVRDIDEARLEPRRRPEHAHLDYLHVSAEGGLLAGLALLSWILGGLVMAYRLVRKDDEESARLGLVAGSVLLTLGIAALADGILIDPGPALLAALAWTTLLLARQRAEPTPTSNALMATGVVLAIPLAAAFGLLTRHAMADYDIQRFVEARVDTRARVLAGTLAPFDAQDLMEQRARKHLDNEALRLDPKNARALRQRGLVYADSGKWGAAREVLRTSLEADPGQTEARLDIAKTFELEGRGDDAQSTLEEAARRDPTRVEVALRLGHLALGPEPVPGDAPEDRSWVPVMRAYNAVEALAPDRFETYVARARLRRRRRDTKTALVEADVLLQEASKPFADQAPEPLRGTPLGALAGAPPEVAVEAFRIAEAMGQDEAVSAGLLKLALQRDLTTAQAIEREAYRFMEIGLEREDSARALVPEKTEDLSREAFDKIRAAYEPAKRAFNAAALRFAALLGAGRIDGPKTLAFARQDGKSRRFRASLARYRALLAWTGGFGDPSAPGVSKHRRWRAELFNEAAAIASRVDGDRSRLYYTQGFTLEAVIALSDDDAHRANKYIKRALKYGPRDGNVLLTHARILCRLKQFDAAADALSLAIREQPSLRVVARRHFDLAPLLDRADIVRLLR